MTGNDILSQIWMTYDLDPETQTCRLAAPGVLRFLQGHLVLHVFSPIFPHIRIDELQIRGEQELEDLLFARAGGH